MHLKGVDLEMQDYDKRTALHIAASEGHGDVVEFLLEVAKVKPDPKDRWKRTPLQDAQAEGHSRVSLLLQRAMAIREQEEESDIIDPTNIHSPDSQDLSSMSSDSPPPDSLIDGTDSGNEVPLIPEEGINLQTQPEFPLM